MGHREPLIYGGGEETIVKKNEYMYVLHTSGANNMLEELGGGEGSVCWVLRCCVNVI